MLTVALAVVLWAVLAYLVLPAFWRHHGHLPVMASMPTTTTAPSGLPGDPVNLALIGDRADVERAFAAIGWRTPVPVTMRSAVEIAESVLLDRPDPTAPVSNLLLFGRTQDLAFEKEVGTSARQRNHVRWWRTEASRGGRPIWLGAATFDRGVGLSHTTGQITHHIGPDVDAERDRIIRALTDAKQLMELFQVTGVGPTIAGRNGGGDRYFTDGEVTVAALAVGDYTPTGPPLVLQSPTPIVLKNQLWDLLRPWLTTTDGPSTP